MWETLYSWSDTSYLNLIPLPFGVSTITFRYPVSGFHAGRRSGPRASIVGGVCRRPVLRAFALCFTLTVLS